MKTISFGSEFKQKFKAGIDVVYEAVKSTLGPKAVSMVLDRGFSVPIVADDGVSIVKALEVNDDIERQGLEMISEVADKTNTVAGDGTTTSIVLAHAIVEEGLKYSENPLEIKRSLDLASYKVIDELKKLSKPLKTDKEILEVATLSAGSEELGQQIFDVFKAVGRDGVISVEEGKLPETQINTVEGYEIEKGWASPYMAIEGKATYEDTKVLVVGNKIDNVPELLPILEKLVKANIRSFVIFCVEIDNAVMNMLLTNRQVGNFKCLVVKANSQKQEILQDVAIMTGAKFISTEAGLNLEKAELNDLGYAKRITATKDKTIILNGKGNPEKKIAELKTQLQTTKDENEYDLIEKRIARLDNSIAVISVGAKTENEMRPKYLKIEDAVNAVKSALTSGIVEGGGMALYRISNLLGDTIGEKILKKALKAPLKQIIENCGEDYTQIILNMPKGKGYDAQNNCYVDMLKAGIIDPTLVEQSCIENAVSFAGVFLTARGCVALQREEPKDE